jgi:hypothetical protein
MATYAPFHNVCPGPYPPLLLTAGLHDRRVDYWQPARWGAGTAFMCVLPGGFLSSLAAGGAGGWVTSGGVLRCCWAAAVVLLDSGGGGGGGGAAAAAAAAA